MLVGKLSRFLILHIVGAVTIFSSFCRAENNNFSISGEVAESGCTIYSGTDMILDYGNLFVSGGKSTPGTILNTQQSMLIITHCPESAYVGYILNGESDDNDNSLFKITSGSGKAEGIAYKVQIKIPSVGSTFIDVHPDIQSAWAATTSSTTAIGSYSLITVKVRAVATLENITPGIMDTIMTYSLLYK